MIAKILPAYLFVCINFTYAAAPQTASELMSEQDYLLDVPKVLTVSRLSQPVADAPAAVTIIDRETIRASGIVDLPDIFRLVPGFYVGTNAGFVHTVNPVVSYHGMTDAYSRRMQVLIDGRTVYEPLYGGVQWSDLSLAIGDIERIEITRGPNAASYGANAFLGVINIVTQHSAEAAGSSVSLTHGNGRNEAFYRYGGKADNDKLSYRVTLGYREDDGLQQRNDYKRTRLLTARADYRASEKDEFEFQFGYNGGAREEGDDNFDAIVFVPRTKDVYSHFEQVRWRHVLGEQSDLSVQAYHLFSKSDDPVTSIDLTTLFAPIPLASPRLNIDNDVENERFDLEAQHTFAPLQSVRIAWGGNIRLDRTTAPFYLNSDDTKSFHLQRLFGHAEWHPLERLVLNAGAMIEHNDLTGTDVSPRISANFRLAPGHTLRMGISTATRTPTYLEEKFQGRIVLPTLVPGLTGIAERFRDSGGLDPERIVSREIGYLGTFNRPTLDARVFNDSTQDLIRQIQVPRPYSVPAGFTRIPDTPRPFDYIQGGDADIRGFEAQAQWKIREGTRLIANYAHVRIYGNEDELERNFLDLAPSNTISALLSHRFNAKWDGSLAYYQTSAVAALGDGQPVDLARHVDARLARSFDSGPWHGEISATAQNLFDSNYQEFAEYNVMRRRAYLNLKLDF